MSPISVAARHRSPAVGNRLICCIKNFLTNFEIGHIGSQLIDLAQGQHVTPRLTAAKKGPPKRPELKGSSCRTEDHNPPSLRFSYRKAKAITPAERHNAIETGPGFPSSSSQHVTLGAIEYLPVADRRTT